MIRIPAFYMLWFSFVLSLLVPAVITSYYKTFGQAFIKNDQYLSLVGSISSILNAVGRPMWGVLLDRFPFKVCLLLLDSSLLCFTITLYISKIIESETMLMIWICALYLSFCGIYVIMPIIVVRCFGQKYFTMNYGLMYTCGVVSSLSTPIFGALINQIGWFGMFCCLTGCVSVSWFMTFFFYVKKSDGIDI